jgi:pimeloyl-ACP methyl ester carboxylesterase
VAIERGLAGLIPYAAIGSGAPVLICAGLWHSTGVGSDTMIRGSIGPLRGLRADRSFVVLNRRADLPRGMTLAEMAAEYADAIREHFGTPVDVVGTSTGGSIAQQLAADHPDTVRRLVLISAACRLGRVGRESQAHIATALRAGQTRTAFAEIAQDFAPPGFRSLAASIGRATAPRVLTDAQMQADLAATLEAEDGFDLAGCAQPIQAHTLIVAGGRDRFYSRDLFEETAALIPHSTLALFRHRGHISVTSDPRARATIAGFLRLPSRDLGASPELLG